MQNPGKKQRRSKRYDQARYKKAKGIDPCKLVTLREREMTAGQVPVLGLYCKKEKTVSSVGRKSQGRLDTRGLWSWSLFMSGELEPSISFTSAVACALPQPLTST
jgi:hypothetical protein